MLTPILNTKAKKPLYEQLYVYIRQNIESGEIKNGERLPSKRKLAEHLRVSFCTVENAYAQLLAEGYITSAQRKGYFASSGQMPRAAKTQVQTELRQEKPLTSSLKYDLKTNAVNTEDFPYATWTKLMRECMREDPKLLLEPIHPQGDYGLREEIARYLRAFRGVTVRAGQILLGAGTEYLLGLICELLHSSGFAAENPGHHKIPKILTSRKVNPLYIPMDSEGMCVDALLKTEASVAIVTPSHHFPLGTIMSIGRRRQLLQWAEGQAGRYVIEDDFDSEFRFVLKPISSLQNLNPDKVIYLNSFAKTLAPSLRIAYAVLPEALLAQYRERLMFYSCTVSAFEQHTLKAFLKDGYYERHLNRMRGIYRSRRDTLIKGLAPLEESVHISGQAAGLHLLLRAPALLEEELVKRALEAGVGVYPLSSYYKGERAEAHTVVVGYAGLKQEELEEAAALLVKAWRD